ncbi:uncharacterized protein METZ01_LOCUS265820 [marine metagenome]|uniref:Uncharacterized protein n=1 Tax=marine metagenome TaxID=408172 RepID=A0A382JMI7_9ZZZZ
MTVEIKKTFDNVDDGIANMLAAANFDYCDGDRFNDVMVAEFKDGWVVKKGSKYIKISTNNGGTAWGFVVNTDTDKKFKKGDLLMCAGYSAPARNAARGNVLDGGFAINWTGPLYLVGPTGYSIKSIKGGVFG